VTDPTFDETEQRIRAAMKRIADGHRPDTDGRWPASHPNGRARAAGSSLRNRWFLVAASLVVVVAGIAAVAVVQLGGDDPATDIAPAPTAVDDPDGDRTPTTPLPQPTSSVPDSVAAEELGGVRFPVDPADEDFEWLVPWEEGFLTGSVVEPDDEGGPRSVQARFTTDGERWEPVEMTMPPGMNLFGRIATVGERFVSVETIYPDPDTEVIRIASTTDLINWSTQDFENPLLPTIEEGSFFGSFTSIGSFAANDTGWVFEVRDTYGFDPSELLPSDAPGDGYRIRSDENGFTVTLGGVDGAPPTTYDYTWAEFGITPDQVPYLTGEIPVSRTWSATWDGTPTMSETAVPTGPTLASPEGFVRWNDNTWFSPDGLTWTASPLPDPTGTVQNVFPVDEGFVAFVVSQDGATDVYRLDERGGEARRIDIDDIPASFSTGFAGQSSPGLQSPQTSAALLIVGPNGGEAAPLVIDLDGYRFVERGQNISLIDLATGDTLYTFSPFSGPPAADTWLTFDSDGFTVTDPVTEVELLQIPIETYRAAQDARREALGPIESGQETVRDFRLLASRDGERFLVEPLRSSTPVDDEMISQIAAATNGDTLLVRLGDEWIRYELSS
jgi:hypothetical protein